MELETCYPVENKYMLEYLTLIKTYTHPEINKLTYVYQCDDYNKFIGKFCPEDSVSLEKEDVENPIRYLNKMSKKADLRFQANLKYGLYRDGIEASYSCYYCLKTLKQEILDNSLKLIPTCECYLPYPKVIYTYA